MSQAELAVLELDQKKSFVQSNKISIKNKLFLSANLYNIKKIHLFFIKLSKKNYFFTKRLFDIFCSLFGILVLIPPVVLVTKICYIATGDFHSIFFKQKRIGLNGKEFDFYKLRSMVPNADQILFEYLKTNAAAAYEYKINKKLKCDPRITRVGRVLRKTSLDELPQFINVLKGDMSVIGNRPYLPREKEDMGVYFDDIERTKCGIVSFWAVEGRSDLSFKKRLKLESYYSYNQSFLLDVKIFLKVFKVIVLKKGAE